ncbi:MAG: hypothetical protein LAO78_23140 [Acidobacteriia bacterium]|nr:hypothetical protein [Terriglobia bacterium]
MPFIDTVEFGKAKFKLRQESEKLTQVVIESENAEVLEASKIPAELPSESKGDDIVTLIREKRLANTTRETKILQIAAVDKFTAILQIGVELEAEMFLLSAMIGLRNQARIGSFRETAQLLASHGLITSNTLAALLEFWRLRNKIAHAQYPVSEDDPLLKSFLDNGLRLLRLIGNIPRPIYRVRQSKIPLFKDQSCTEPINEYVGVLLTVTEADGSVNIRIYPAGREFKDGEIVGWDWDLTRTFSAAYYVDPETNKPAIAWSESAAFVGRNEDLRFNALRDQND